MKTGWHDDADGNTYYLNSEGVMLTGRQTIKGRTYYFDEMGALQD
jgi:dextransucrase